MFGIGGQELIIILILALILLGPKKLPDIAKSLGRALGEFQRATDDLKKEFDQASDLTSEANKKENNAEKAPQLETGEKKEPQEEQQDKKPESSPEDTPPYKSDEIEG